LRFGLLLTAAAWCVAIPAVAAEYAAPAATEPLRGLVVLAEEAELSPRETGILKEVAGSDGKTTRVDAGQVVLQLDDTRAQAELKVAQAEYLAARTKADDFISIRYAEAAAEMAKKDLDFSVKANHDVPGSVPQAKINEMQLKVTETTLGIEKAKHDHEIAVSEVGIAAAKVEAAKTMIDLLKVYSPIDGEVDVVRKHKGEAVQPNEPGVIHIVNREKLWVQVRVEARAFAREQLENQPVSVEAEVAGGRKLSVSGKVINVSSQTDSGGTYAVRAEVRRESRDAPWLYPGMQAKMVISLKQ
jgi:multidrug resistance efflux pump